MKQPATGQTGTSVCFYMLLHRNTSVAIILSNICAFVV